MDNVTPPVSSKVGTEALSPMAFFPMVARFEVGVVKVLTVGELEMVHEPCPCFPGLVVLSDCANDEHDQNTDLSEQLFCHSTT